MGFRHSQSRDRNGNRTNRTNRGQRSSVASAVAIVLVFELLVWCNPASSLSPRFHCYRRKDRSSYSSSFSSWKPFKYSTTANIPIALATRSNHDQLAVWVPKEAFGHYHPTYSNMGSISALFSENRDETDIGASDRDGNEEGEKSLGDNNNDKKKGAFSIWGDVRYGVNHVHKNFLGLSWNVYSQTLLWTAPFVVLLFIVLPAWSSSSSPSLRLLATKTQGFLRITFEILAKASRVFYVRPMNALVRWIISWCSTGSAASASTRIAWRSSSSRRNLFLWGLLWGPMVEEMLFRLAFRGFWKALFRPVGSNNGNNRNFDKHEKEFTELEACKNLVVDAPDTFLSNILAPFRPTTHQTKMQHQQRYRYTDRSWRIASGICFGIAHFSNFFPIDLQKFTLHGEIRLPSGTVRERFLLALFPGDFASRTANKEFCLTSMVLIGAIYQAMHCFFGTMILYGPLLDSDSTESKSKSKRGGIFAAIGAHIAWNTNVLWLTTNLQLRLLCKLVVTFPLFRSTQQRKNKRQDEK